MKFSTLVKFTAVPALLLSQAASAIDLTQVTDGITQATSDGTTVGTAVIGGVVALIGIGIIIGMIRKFS